ncbi:MAG: hypothetical protein KDJ38_11805 [Gammaproteobacteria bacterium]|nr:hypothetical protein [Gammaproteobacteria bacterium]
MSRCYLGLVMLVLLTGCASKEYNEHIQGIISYELDPELNRFSAEHVACYVCETGNIPTTVKEITTYEATTEECEPLFKNKEISFLHPRFREYLATVKKLEGRDVYVFTKEGLGYDEVESISGKEPWFSMALWYNKHKCLPNN